MRVDDIGPRTWLLATIAGWLVLAWVLALAGMGRRVQPLADAALLPPLPAAAANAPPALDAREAYDPVAARPLFAPDRRPQPFFLQGEAGAATDQAFDYVLSSVLISPRVKLAILQPGAGGDAVRVRLDQAPQSHPGWRLVELEPRRALSTDGAERRELQLRVFDGEGGAAPTAPAANGTRAAAVPPVLPPAGNGNGAATTDAAGQTPATPASVTGADAESKVTTDQAQMDAIRKRIEARRAQMREQQLQPPPSGNSR